MCTEVHRSAVERGGTVTKLVDLTQEIYTGMPVFPGHQPTVLYTVRDVAPRPGGPWAFAARGVLLADHAGTHVDAFNHMDPAPDAPSIEHLPLDRFYTRGVCLDLRHTEPGHAFTAEELAAACDRAGLAVPDGGTVLLYTGHHERSFGTAAWLARHAGLGREGAQWLADHGAGNVGIDAPNIDATPHREGDEWQAGHAVCRERRMLNMENLTNLSQVAGRAFRFIAFPLPLRGATASPVRAVAVLDD